MIRMLTYLNSITKYNFHKYIKKYNDNRHTRAVKVSLNKIFGNNSVLNKELSKIITSFSHSCIISGGSFLVSSNLKFFIVQKLLSNHWCIGWFCPSRIDFSNNHIMYVPNLLWRGKMVRKRVNNPFSWRPSINIRKQIFYLQLENLEAYNRVPLFSVL